MRKRSVEESTASPDPSLLFPPFGASRLFVWSGGASLTLLWVLLAPLLLGVVLLPPSSRGCFPSRSPPALLPLSAAALSPSSCGGWCLPSHPLAERCFHHPLLWAGAASPLLLLCGAAFPLSPCTWWCFPPPKVNLTKLHHLKIQLNDVIELSNMWSTTSNTEGQTAEPPKDEMDRAAPVQRRRDEGSTTTNKEGTGKHHHPKEEREKAPQPKGRGGESTTTQQDGGGGG